MFDVRKGEARRTVLLTLYLMLVLFAYYILKPVSRAIFLSALDIDKLPWLYVLIAGVGGIFAYFYTKLAVMVSLRRAVDFATFLSILILIGFWWLVGSKQTWVLYAFNIWVSLFSIMLVAQGWFVAANVFNTREAKRLYGILGVGSVIGAAFGGSFTAATVKVLGTNNLILASAGMVLLSYIVFLITVSLPEVSLSGKKAVEGEPQSFSFGEIVTAIRRHRHLQVIIAIMVITFVIDVMVEFQFNAQAKLAYKGHKDQLTAFLGNFYGLWLNLITFVLQFFITSFVVSHFGVGGTLQIMPITIALASIASLVAPGLFSTASTRLWEASTRYSFNKTGMELLYLPLPLELRNRTKAFVDIFVDRLSRGIGGMILVFFTAVVVIPFRFFALIVMIFSVAWIFLSMLAKREYIATVRKRLELRRLDFENVRIRVEDRSMLQLLEATVRDGSPRQAGYALSLLATVSGYDLSGPLRAAAAKSDPELRGPIFDIAASAGLRDLLDDALAEIRSARSGDERPSIRPATRYVLALDAEPKDMARRLLEHPNALVAESAAVFLAERPEMASEVMTPEWLAQAAHDPSPARRRLAAIAARVGGLSGAELLRELIRDSEPRVAEAALASVAVLQDRQYLPAVIEDLRNPRLRGAAIETLASFGPKIVGTLSDTLHDESAPAALRRQIPRVLRLIPSQRSVDVLLEALRNADLALRSPILRALNRLRENDPKLDYGAGSISDQVMAEAKSYLEQATALAAFADQPKPHTPAGLLYETLENRLNHCLERMFRLLGLRYPPLQIYAAWRAVQRGKGDDLSAALEFLDNVLDRELKRVIVPLLDASDNARLVQFGQEYFGLERKSIEDALRDLMRGGDEWLASCAVATAAELQLKSLAPEAERLSHGDNSVSEVAREAALALA